MAYRVKATTESRPTRYVITRSFSGTQLAQNFPQSSFSWKTLYTVPSEVSSFSSYVSLMRLSSLKRGTARHTPSFVVDGARESVSLFVVDICPAVIGSNASQPHSFPLNCTSSLHLHQLAMNFRWCDSFDVQNRNKLHTSDIWSRLK